MDLPYPLASKTEHYNGLLKTMLKAMGGGSFKHWEKHLAENTWLVNTRGSISRDSPAGSLYTVKGDKVPIVHIESMLRKAVWVFPASGKGKPLHGTVFCPGTGVHLVGDAEKQGRSMCTTREFDVGGVQSVIPCIYINVCACV